MNFSEKLLLGLVFTTLFLAPSFGLAQEEKITLHFFYSETCPHCIAEGKFLDKIESQYPDLEIQRHLVTDQKNVQLMIQLAKEHGAERHLGGVPLTFVGGEFFAGFDDEDGIGQQIEAVINKNYEKTAAVSLPLAGKINPEKYSLPALSVILGFLDGFNVCSLGALALILGMVLILGSRKKILLFGGIFILTTAVIYGLLIVLWYKFFSLLTPYMKFLEIGIGLLGITGAIVFFRQFLKFRKYGPTCEMTGSKTVGKLTTKLQNAFRNPTGILTLIGIVFLFSAVITIVEFPCSAAIPVVFAGLLSQAQISTFSYLLYIAIFIFFYMLDELIVFGIAVSKMHLWLTSSKWTVWITLIEALILGGLGLYYLIGAL